MYINLGRERTLAASVGIVTPALSLFVTAAACMAVCVREVFDVAGFLQTSVISNIQEAQDEERMYVYMCAFL